MSTRLLLVTALALAALPAAAQKGGDPMAFTIASDAFAAGARIPRDLTCDGKDESPPLAWAGVPAGTQFLALICDDPDAPGGTWVHWVIFNIPAAAKGLSRGVKPIKELADGSIQGKNDFGKLGYGGPCPPKGAPHHYAFTLYALSRKLSLASGATKKQALAAMQGLVLGTAVLVGVYGR